MIRSRWIFFLFCILVMIQIAVPFSMLVRRERVLRTGEQFKFKTAPVDPIDVFRGRYVAIGIEENRTAVPKGLTLQYGQKVYAIIETDESGFARLKSVSLSPPAGKTYIRAKVDHADSGEVRLMYPFDRYYMEEGSAPKAEEAYREHSMREEHDAYVTVRVRSGYAVLEELYVDGKPIGLYIKETGSR